MKDSRCPNPAFFRYTWPGKDEAVCCPTHGQAILTVAKAIGLHLQLVPLSQESLFDGIQCQSADDIPKESQK